MRMLVTLTCVRRRLLALRSDERGVTLVEMMTTMAILTVVVSSLIGLFVSGTNAEVGLNRRFQAQEQARLALDVLRREIHNACQVVYSGPVGSRYATITLRTLAAVPTTSCVTTSATWCVTGNAVPYALYRKTGGTCNTTGVRWAGDLTSNAIFAPVTGASLLPKVDIDLPVNTQPSVSRYRFELQDTIVLRNALQRG